MFSLFSEIDNFAIKPLLPLLCRKNKFLWNIIKAISITTIEIQKHYELNINLTLLQSKRWGSKIMKINRIILFNYHPLP